MARIKHIGNNIPYLTGSVIASQMNMQSLRPATARMNMTFSLNSSIEIFDIFNYDLDDMESVDKVKFHRLYRQTPDKYSKKQRTIMALIQMYENTPPGMVYSGKANKVDTIKKFVGDDWPWEDKKDEQ